jgi:hypothetical protein
MMYDSNEEKEASIGNEWIVENLCLSDNVAILISIDEPFWLLRVDKGPHTVITSLNDEDGNVWTKGNVVVHGF